LCESDRVGEGTRIWAFAHIMRGATIGRDCNICDGAFVEGGAVLGDRVTIKNQVMIWNGVTIGDDVFIGPGAIFTNDRNPRSARMPEVHDRYSNPDNWLRPIVVEQGASIGGGAIIVPGVTVGRYAMVGAGAVVTRDVLPHQLVLGNPARPAGWVCVCGGRIDFENHCTLCGNEHHPIDEPQSARA
jgi:acetyltransferase-like isoleucine patch superfamily enzyme